MQNSFWFLGAEGRFQEIKQTIRFGNSPKSGAFWPQNRGGQLSRSGALLIFPKDWEPGQGWVQAGVESPPKGGLGGLDTSWCLFPTGSLGQKWGEWAAWTALPRPCPRGARWHYWLILIYWLECLPQRILSNRAFQKTDHSGSWRLALTAFSGLLWVFTVINHHRDPKHRQWNVWCFKAHLVFYF